MEYLRSRQTFYRILFIVLIWMIPLVSIASSEPQTDTNISDVRKGNHKLPPHVEGTSTLQSGQDARGSHLIFGERMFRSRDLAKAREAFEKVLELDSRNAQAYYFLGLIEYEQGNLEKAKARFQIAHECLSSWMDILNFPIDSKQVQVEFPDDYEARIYYRDGWYISPKDPLAVHRPFHSLDAGSTYRVQVKSSHKESWVYRGMLTGFMIALSFFMAR